MPMRLHLLIVLAALFTVTISNALQAGLRDVERFYGAYEGEGVAVEDGVKSKRGLVVEIGPTEDGFVVKWSTTIFVDDSPDRTSSYSVNFTKSRREDIFTSQMRVNKFGSRVPLDPLKGDPLIWSRLIDDTLTVYGMRITKEGSFDLQVYHRTRTDEGMTLDYTRILEGKSIRTVTGTLEEVPR
jgi:hypothetical protein